MALSTFSSILADQVGEPDRDPATLTATIERITGSARRMRALIDDLLAYATTRDKPLNLDLVDLTALVAEITAEHTAGAVGAAAAPRIAADDLPTVVADPAMLRQLLDNLIGNAVKYTHRGQPAQIEVSARVTADATEIVIDDNGIGIPKAEQPHVFDAFHRASTSHTYTGTGLGLAICQRIVDRHGGHITATTNPAGTGTRITVTLPGPLTDAPMNSPIHAHAS